MSRLPHISAHAQRRMQQRGISAEALALLLEIGRTKRQNGGVIVYLDRAARRALDEAHERLRRVYAVLDRGEATVLTVSYRTRNLKLH